MFRRPLLDDILQRWVERFAVFSAVQRGEAGEGESLVDARGEVGEPLAGEDLWRGFFPPFCGVDVFLCSMLALLVGPAIIPVVKAFGELLALVTPT